jgi:hypothetical protein
LLTSAALLPVQAIAFLVAGYAARGMGIAVDPLAVVADAFDAARTHIFLANLSVARAFTARSIEPSSVALPPN